MALTRKFLAALGIEADKANEIIDAHTEVVDRIQKELDDLKDQSGDSEALQKELDETKERLGQVEQELEEAKANTSTEELEKLKEEFDNYKAEIEEKEKTENVRKAYRDLLKENGVSEKRLDTILKVADLADLKLGEDGKLEDAEKLTESIKEEWADFIETRSESGSHVSNPPEGNGGGKGASGRAAELARQYHEARYGSAKEE